MGTGPTRKWIGMIHAMMTGIKSSKGKVSVFGAFFFGGGVMIRMFWYLIEGTTEFRLCFLHRG